MANDLPPVDEKTVCGNISAARLFLMDKIYQKSY